MKVDCEAKCKVVSSMFIYKGHIFQEMLSSFSCHLEGVETSVLSNKIALCRYPNSGLGDD